MQVFCIVIIFKSCIANYIIGVIMVIVMWFFIDKYTNLIYCDPIESVNWKSYAMSHAKDNGFRTVSMSQYISCLSLRFYLLYPPANKALGE